jgi:drug/metabolite transporter (DMT)-like permease
MNEKNSTFFAVSILVLATVLWGSTFAFTKELTKAFSPINLVTVRFLFTSIIMFLIFFKTIISSSLKFTKESFLWLLLMGSVNFISIFLQTVGLKEIAASNSGFITSLSTLIVPIVEYFIWKKKIKSYIVVAILISLCGIYFMSYGFSFPERFIFGDFITLLCAVTYAFHIILVGIVSKKIKAVPMMFYLFLITGIISLPISFLTTKNSLSIFSNLSTILGSLDIMVYFNMLCLIIIGSIIPYILMGIGQKILDAHKAALVYMLEPVFAMLIAILFFSEAPMVYKFAGGGIILFAQFIGLKEIREGLILLIRNLLKKENENEV